MNTELYSDFYKTYFKTIKKWVAKSGIPFQEVDDVSSSIILTILEKDGMGKYDPSRNVKVNTYLNNYVFLTARSYREKLLSPRVRVNSYAEVPDYSTRVDLIDHSLLDKLKTMVDGDALVFLNHASESDNYTQARKCLSDKGWDKRRITLAVLEVRKAARLCLSGVNA